MAEWETGRDRVSRKRLRARWRRAIYAAILPSTLKTEPAFSGFGMDAKAEPTHPSAPAHESERLVHVRNSRDSDVPAMLAIYLHHIRRGVDPGVDGDFETPDADDLKRRRRSMNNRKMPHLVAEEAGTVVGYAYAVPFRKRPAYRYTVKHSIYVRSDRLQLGIGLKLMTALIDACAAAGFRQMIGYIDGANVASIKLHEKFGFRQVGFLPAVGFKFGRWTDSIMMQRSLGPGATESPAA
jgi:L-amino acid N-acyltransferase YncA